MDELKDESLLPKNRLETLCDGIFAITMTLMILDLKTPQNIPSNLANEELPDILFNLLPSIEAYAISFIVLAVFWLRHQIQFKYIKSVNRFIIFLNIFFLLLIGFVPFTVGLMMRYPDFDLTFRIYIINLVAICILLMCHWIYIAHSNNITAIEITRLLNKRFLYMGSVPLLIFILSFTLSYFNLRLAFLIIYLDPLFYVFYRKFGVKSFNKA